MTSISRRTILIGASAGFGAVAIPSVSATSTDRVAEGLRRYIDFGDKASGGPGDTTCGEWLHAELAEAGFAVRRQAIAVPYFAAVRTELVCARATATVIPQAIVVPTGAAGVTGRLVSVSPTMPPPANAFAGAIALIDLPYGRWSSAAAKPIRSAFAAAIASGARAVILVTNGPTGKAIALNAPGDAPMFAVPVAILAPDAAQPFRDAARAGASATLYLTGTSGRRPAFNLIGTIGDRSGPWLIVSTPRSGWFGCAGERGSGVTAWLALAHAARAAFPAHNLAFICTSGHEYENLGAEHLRYAMPSPARTALWYHLGANVAARDWQELTGTLLPLPSADAQRYLATTADLLDAARGAFSGQPGLEAPRNVGDFSTGELGTILAGGYPRVAGIFGAHRYHHTREDDARCVLPSLVAAAIAASATFLTSALAT